MHPTATTTSAAKEVKGGERLVPDCARIGGAPRGKRSRVISRLQSMRLNHMYRKGALG